MKYYGKCISYISILILTFFIGGCGFMNKENNKEAEIKKSFHKTLKMYPIKNLKDYKNGNVSYNPNVPSYSAEYQLSNEDDNVKQLRKRYNIPTKKAPKLLLKGDGDFKGSSIGHKHVKLSFVRNKEESIYFSDSVEFNPSEVNNELK
ncbi:tandem-type lipoprotein [Staphylococcus epidermidis]|uniref:tandem-type lipoprotein n=1 Tax=Staphylococcus epidermidis TaxID=1282 RepID=UPI0021D0688B|nr:tandem-type lipoprotein [Staphylococcus epidermidis]UXR89146.1 tandem-type lipoprotein [Staphylococcus epidermidis]